ncbi:MAG: hypothetical protein A3F18_01160 [Legionellales bacterium RIFCSPHIGHO2_12_FULL_37_14]|nr:MAG: hypothetical protein A3F18_01160 [Legionellales bacterium RIFCSPHIGHO2_12_FULL_37_14]
MNTDVSKSFESLFGDFNDPRIDRTKLYPLTEVLFIVLTGLICGAESWRDFVLFGNAKLDFLRQYFSFSNGIPSKSTFSRIFAMLDPAEFKLQFIEWVRTLQNLLDDTIAIDGKTLCNSLDVDKSAIHMVSAFATQARLVLAQQKYVSSQIDWLNQKTEWASLKTVGLIEETRKIGEQTSIERRFFISSLGPSATRIARADCGFYLS